MNDYAASVEKMDTTRKEIIGLFVENDMEPNEALSLLSGMLVQIYYDMVENKSRENFTDIMTQCYDAFVLINSEPEGSVH